MPVESRHRDAPTYQMLLDRGKHPIRGLWIRTGHYYARLNFTDPETGAVKPAGSA